MTTNFYREIDNWLQQEAYPRSSAAVTLRQRTKRLLQPRNIAIQDLPRRRTIKNEATKVYKKLFWHTLSISVCFIFYLLLYTFCFPRNYNIIVKLIKRALCVCVCDYRNDQSLRWEQFVEEAALPSYHGSQASSDCAISHGGPSCIPHHKRSE